MPHVWQELGETIEDTGGEVLLNPQVVTATPSLILVLDWGDRQLKALGHDGRVRWKFGRRGAGPGELGAPGMVMLGGDGLIWLTDRGNSRAYGLDSLGRLRRAVQLPMPPERAFSRADGLIFVQPNLEPSPVLVDTLGQVRARLPLAPASLAADPFIRVDVRAVALPNGPVALLYSWASLLVLYDTSGKIVSASGPDGIAFPPMKRVRVAPGVARLDPATTRPRVGLSLATDGKQLFVLTGLAEKAQDDDLSDLVDMFDARTLAYQGSWRLPRRIYDMAVAGTELIGLYRTPAPGIVRWRLPQGTQ